MSLKSKFKADAQLMREGKWFDLDTNSDGTKCRIKLRRSGRGNPLWSVSYRENTKDKDTDAISPDEDEQITVRIFCESSVADWEHMQPNDDGHNLEFSFDNAFALLSDPDWIILLNDLQVKAQGIKEYQREEDAKN